MQILETDVEGKTVADLTHLEGVGPHVTVVDMAKGKDVVVKLGETEATLVSAEYSDASAEVNVTDPPARPSLDVAIETLGHLRPRIEALCLRMLGWDKREMGAELRTAFEESVDRFEANAATLATALELLRNKGFPPSWWTTPRCILPTNWRRSKSCARSARRCSSKPEPAKSAWST